MEKNIETLATALYVKIDDMLTEEPGLAPWRPEGSIPVTVSDSELLTMAVMSALLGFRSERRWLRYCGGELRHLFPRQVGQSGYNKRIRKMIFLLHLVCTLQGLPVMFAVAGAKACERDVLPGMLEIDAALVAARPGQTLIGDKNYFGRLFEQAIADSDLALLRPVRKGEARRAGQQYLKPLRQVIESVNQTLKGQLDLEGHGA